MTKKTDLPAHFAENPEWTAEDFAEAVPFKDMFPEQFASWEILRRAPSGLAARPQEKKPSKDQFP